MGMQSCTCWVVSCDHCGEPVPAVDGQAEGHFATPALAREWISGDAELSGAELSWSVSPEGVVECPDCRLVALRAAHDAHGHVWEYRPASTLRSGDRRVVVRSHRECACGALEFLFPVVAGG